MDDLDGEGKKAFELRDANDVRVGCNSVLGRLDQGMRYDIKNNDSCERSSRQVKGWLPIS